MRLRGVLKDPLAHDVVCAGIFAALHLPNPFLTAVTFGAGYCFCVLFRRCPNLFAIGAAHALASSTLYFCLPPAITHLMKVGPGYLLDLPVR
jgi:membrane protease YdiL (CAAX protease family)